jgi:hypothetical protein
VERTTNKAARKIKITYLDVVGSTKLKHGRDTTLHGLVKIERAVRSKENHAIVSLDLREKLRQLCAATSRALSEKRLALVKEQNGIAHLCLAEETLRVSDTKWSARN